VKRIGYYPGCALLSSSKDYNASIHAVFERLGVALEEVADWICCGASSAHTTNDLLALALPARTLALTEQAGLSALLAPCSACFSRLLLASERMKEDEDLSRRVNDVIAPLHYRGTVVVKNILDVLVNEIGISEISGHLVRGLDGIRVVAYYGCWLTRTVRIPSFDDREDPHSMDRILTAVGAEPLSWSAKMDCCGGSLGLSEEGLTQGLCRNILRAARDVGAEAMVTTCPLCQANVDIFAYKHKDEDISVPIVYLTDLLGIALGCHLKGGHWRKKFIDPTAVLKRHALLS
jgi:heterodisulfide reductase subunit B